MIYLKQSTAATIKLGPFVDSGDGVTAETGLTIQKADVRLSKNGGNMAAAAADQGESDAGAAHDELGYYDISLGTGDTDTLGRLKVMVSESGALPVWAEYEVVPANVFDSIVAGTDYLQADAVEIHSDATAASNAESFFDGTGYAGTNNVIPTVTSVTNGVSLADDAITSAKFDESTAFPLKSADTGATAVARHSAADAATAVWAAGTRTLTSFGTLAADAAAAVWAIATSTLTSAGTIGKLLVDKMGQLLGTIAAGTHNAQSGDAYGVVTNVTYGNSAIKTETGLIYADTDELQKNQGNWATATGFATPTNVTDATSPLATSSQAESISQAIDALNDISTSDVQAIIDVIAGATWTDETLEAIKAAVDALEAGTAPTVEEIEAYLASKHGAGTWGGAAGEGPNYKELRYYADEAKSIPIRSVRVTLHTDAACETPHVYGPQYSDVFGTTKWHLDAGTYYVLSQHADYTFTIVEITVP